MTEIHLTKIGNTVQSFLDRPIDRNRFEDFYRLCCAETVSYLRILRAAGWRLPEDQVQQENALDDMASDILGAFLASEKDQPFFVVCDYYRRHRLTGPDTTAEAAGEHFRILLRGFIRRELMYLRGLENPQIKNLKRRIGDILAGPDYTVYDGPGDNRAWVCTAHDCAKPPNETAEISAEQLRCLVLEAFRDAQNRAEWCRRVFELLEQTPDVCPALPKHRLVGTMVAVNAEHVDAAGIMSGHVASPSEAYLRRTVSEAIDETLAWVWNREVVRLVDKGRLPDEKAPAVLEACRNYLIDLGANGEVDKIPRYFLSLVPDVSQSEYLSKYKFIMDTVVARAIAELRRRLREDSTIWPFGSYSPQEES